MTKIGSRVGAILSSNNDEITILGYGVYEGEKIPKGAVGFMAEALVKEKILNPAIKLDSGKYVYGCECWWGPEDSVKEHCSKAKKVIMKDIDEVRNEYRQHS